MTNTVYVVGLTDHADGNAYVAELSECSTKDAFDIAVRMLTKSDHVCIIDLADYDKLAEHTYFTLAPYSINISKGIYA